MFPEGPVFARRPVDELNRKRPSIYLTSCVTGMGSEVLCVYQAVLLGSQDPSC